MLSGVNSFLGFDRGCIPNREFVVIGKNQEQGGFMLHQIVSASLRERKTVCLLSFSQKFHHYNAVSQKIGVNLQSAVDTKRFHFCDGLEELSKTFYPVDISTRADHANVLSTLKESLLSSMRDLTQESQNDPVLVIDEISVLLSMGFRSCDVCFFVRDLLHKLLGFDCAHPQQKTSALTVLCSYHKDVEDSLNLWNCLVSLCSIDISVTGLQTGYCRDVHGQVCVTWRDGMDTPRQHSTKTRQFKLVDNNVEFFAAGTSPAVL